MKNERRKFNRVDFDTNGALVLGDKIIRCHLLDLSLHGALISLLEDAEIEMGSECQLNIPLEKDGPNISMMLKMIHQKEEQLGFECLHIDVESITHLRQVVELNLGDSNVLERDFLALVQEN